MEYVSGVTLTDKLKLAQITPGFSEFMHLKENDCRPLLK